ncbi:hypothetical protein V6N13_003342 [Hibiscus sabdariffa]
MPNEWHTPLEVPGNRLPETGSRRKLLNVRGIRGAQSLWDRYLKYYNLTACILALKVANFKDYITATNVLETTAFTLNRVPSKSVQKTPHEMWTRKRPKTQPLRRSVREHHEPERYGFLVTTHGDVILVDQDEPKTYQEAVLSPDSEKWLEAMRSEMDSMSENQVWTLVEPPEGIKPIGCKWVFKKNIDMDGNVQTYKGRLVAKGFRQIHGVDYDETFSPVAMIKSIRILLAIAAFQDYEIWQMDVKSSFLMENSKRMYT